MKFVCPSYIAKRRDSLAFKLFTYMTAIVISILAVQAVAEQAFSKSNAKSTSERKSRNVGLSASSQCFDRRRRYG